MLQLTKQMAGIYGVLLGDAFGVAHEFKTADQIPVRGLEMVMPDSYAKTYPNIPYGTWSDDASQLLCLLESLEANDGKLDTTDFAARMIGWLRLGEHQAGKVVFDCGLQTLKALERIEKGGPAERSVDSDVRSNGNGSLMRCLPVALIPSLWGRPPDEIITLAMQQSRVTHAHPIAQVCCALYCEMARLLLIGEHLDQWATLAESASKTLSSHAGLSQEYRDALNVVMAGRHELPSGSGYCVSTFWTSLWALERSSDFVSTVRLVVRLGGDTDTTACVAGGLSAIAYGLGSVPDDWWQVLRMPRESRELLLRCQGLRAR